MESARAHRSRRYMTVLEARRKAMQNLKAIAEENHELNKDVPAEVIEQEIFEAIKEVRQDK